MLPPYSVVERKSLRPSQAVAEAVASRALWQEVDAARSRGLEVEYLRAETAVGETVEVVFRPETGRAGVASGGAAAWTRAESSEDALQRYLGLEGKELSP